MIRIRELRRVNGGESPQIHISYFVTIEEQTLYREVIVDDFDIENSTIEQVQDIVELNDDSNEILEIYKNRRKRKSSTYRHDGSTFRSEVNDKVWEVGGVYEVNDIVEYENDLYRCVQAHTVSDPTWTPTATAALWSKILVFADEYRPWQQPQGAHDAYPLGAIVSHNDQLWISDHEANVWEPPTQWSEYIPNGEGGEEPGGETPEWAPDTSYSISDQVVYNDTTYSCIQAHTSQVGWEPPNVPSLWEVV